MRKLTKSNILLCTMILLMILSLSILILFAQDSQRYLRNAEIISTDINGINIRFWQTYLRDRDSTDMYGVEKEALDNGVLKERWNKPLLGSSFHLNFIKKHPSYKRAVLQFSFWEVSRDECHALAHVFKLKRLQVARVLSIKVIGADGLDDFFYKLHKKTLINADTKADMNSMDSVSLNAACDVIGNLNNGIFGLVIEVQAKNSR
jgi:hypothetical protein